MEKKGTISVSTSTVAVEVEKKGIVTVEMDKKVLSPSICRRFSPWPKINRSFAVGPDNMLTANRQAYGERDVSCSEFLITLS